MLKGARRTECKRDQTTYYIDVSLTVRQTGDGVTLDGPIGGREMGPLMTSMLAWDESCLHEGAFQ